MCEWVCLQLSHWIELVDLYKASVSVAQLLSADVVRIWEFADLLLAKPRHCTYIALERRTKTQLPAVQDHAHSSRKPDIASSLTGANGVQRPSGEVSVLMGVRTGLNHQTPHQTEFDVSKALNSCCLESKIDIASGVRLQVSKSRG